MCCSNPWVAVVPEPVLRIRPFQTNWSSNELVSSRLRMDERQRYLCDSKQIQSLTYFAEMGHQGGDWPAVSPPWLTLTQGAEAMELAQQIEAGGSVQARLT